jgi:hypothetical protein
MSTRTATVLTFMTCVMRLPRSTTVQRKCCSHENKALQGHKHDLSSMLCAFPNPYSHLRVDAADTSISSSTWLPKIGPWHTYTPAETPSMSSHACFELPRRHIAPNISLQSVLDKDKSPAVPVIVV